MTTLYEISKHLDKSAGMILQQPRHAQLGLLCYLLECIDAKLLRDDESIHAGELLDNLSAEIQSRLKAGQW